MAPAFRNSSAVAYRAGTTLVTSAPAGIAAGDGFVSIAAIDGDRTASLNTPSGWARQGIDFDATMNATFAVDTALFGATMPTYTWGGASTNRASAIGAWSGVAAASTFHGYDRAAGTSRAPAVTGPTTDVADELVLFFVFQISLAEPSGLPAGFTPRIADSGSTGATVADLAFARTGAVGTLAGVLDTSTRWIASTLAIRPDAVPASTPRRLALLGVG